MATKRQIEAAAKAIFYCQHSIMHDHEKLWKAQGDKRDLWRECAVAAFSAAAEYAPVS